MIFIKSHDVKSICDETIYQKRANTRKMVNNDGYIRYVADMKNIME